MQEIKNSQEEKWVLCHNSSNIFHIAKVGIGANLKSGQPNMEKFDTKEEAISRVKEINPNHKINIE